MGKAKQPVTIAGIEFDALISETRDYTATIPSYPIESGFPVSDTIILDPLSLSLTLFLSNTPVTWLYRHGSDNNRVERICDRIEDMWFSKELVKVVTSDKIYTNMGITSLSIAKSSDYGYSRQITMNLTKVETTEKQTVLIPADILKSGETEANAGVATTSKTSSKASSSGATRRSQRSKVSSSSSGEKKNAYNDTIKNLEKISGGSHSFAAANMNDIDTLMVNIGAEKLFGNAKGTALISTNKKSTSGGGVR